MLSKEYNKYILVPFIKENKLTFSIFVTINVLILLIVIILLPVIYSFFVSNLRTSHGDSYNFDLKSNFPYIICFIVIFITLIIFEKIRSLSEFNMNKNFLNNIRVNFIKQLVVKYKQNYEEPNIGEIIPRLMSLSNDSVRYFGLVLRVNLYMLLILIISISVFVINKPIGILFILFTLIYIYLSYKRFNITKKQGVNVTKSFIKTTENITDSCSNLMNVFINNQEKKLIDDNVKGFNKHNQNIDIWDKYQNKYLSHIFLFIR